MSLNAVYPIYYSAAAGISQAQKTFEQAAQSIASGINAGINVADSYVATGLDTSIRAAKQAINNAQSGYNFTDTADAALGNISQNLQRIRELSIQASNGIFFILLLLLIILIIKSCILFTYLIFINLIRLEITRRKWLYFCIFFILFMILLFLLIHIFYLKIIINLLIIIKLIINLIIITYWCLLYLLLIIILFIILNLLLL